MAVDDHVYRLRRRGARDRLAERERYRLVVEAYRHGVTQRQISYSLGTLSQATIARMLQNVTANPNILRRTPVEVVDRCVAGDISPNEMMSQLLELLHAADGVDMEGESTGPAPTSSDWDEMKRTTFRELLTEEQFETLKRNLEQSGDDDHFGFDSGPAATASRKNLAGASRSYLTVT